MSVKSKALQWAILAVVVGGLVGCGLEMPELPDGSLGGSEGESDSANSEPSSEEAASSGDSGRITYVAGDEETVGIFSRNPQGSDERRIADDVDIYDLSYSPDGSKMAFIKGYDLYTAYADGSGGTQLAEDEDYISSPTFSPDGEFIAFSAGSGPDAEIYTVRVDGSELEQLTDGPGELESKDNPAWNPQESEIAFQATYDAGSNDDDTIYTVDFPDGDNLVQVTESDDPDNEYDPEYSPDGKTIAYASSEETYYAGAGDIYTIAANGSERGNATRLTDSNRNLEPVFSPDGERIAYASTSSPRGYETYDIFTMDSETGDDKYNVTETSGRGENSPSWSKKPGG